MSLESAPGGPKKKTVKKIPYGALLRKVARRAHLTPAEQLAWQVLEHHERTKASIAFILLEDKQDPKAKAAFKKLQELSYLDQWRAVRSQLDAMDIQHKYWKELVRLLHLNDEEE